MSTWERFTHRKFKSFSTPKATITNGGQLSMNYAVMTEYVKENNFAVLFYNKDEALIGIKFQDKDAPDAYKIRRYRNDKLGYISITAFLNYYKIPSRATESYTPKWEEKEKLMIIDIKNRVGKKPKSKQIPAEDIL
ncbi:MAG: hypothetical protein MUP52_00950 [Candidatus Aminicenantes bacterium]|nr:hypothetical protein [Candidatus Aminicenantes bacterium]